MSLIRLLYKKQYSLYKLGQCLFFQALNMEACFPTEKKLKENDFLSPHNCDLHFAIQTFFLSRIVKYELAILTFFLVIARLAILTFFAI